LKSIFDSLLSFYHRHKISKARLQRHTKVFTPQKSVFLKETGKQLEKVFFWRVLSIATIGLFFFSIVPQFTVSGVGYAAPPEELENTPEEELIFVEDGFLMKPEIWTEVGDRSDVSGVVEYEVQPGDTISAIAKKNGVTTKTILQNNGFLDPGSLRSGTKLKIPAVNGLLHSVKKGESVDAIAKKYSIDKERIIAQNDIAEDGTLFEGQELIIPGVAIKKPEPKIVAKEVTSSGSFRAAAPDISPGKETGGTLLFPTQGKYTQYYHYGHYAVDIAKGGGAPIYASEDGKVIKAAGGWNGGYGNVIVIDHGGGMKTLYAHNREIYVSVGDTVRRGDVIGYMGNTGRVYGRTGIHLHYEVIVNGQKKNPIAYF
jgi:murein DD-endopeptidase MepM/ murein hydrolase activator NlpD